MMGQGMKLDLLAFRAPKRGLYLWVASSRSANNRPALNAFVLDVT